MVIVYRMSGWNRAEYLLVRNTLPPHIGMPNLLAERRICPEFVQDEATPENLAGEVIGLLLEPERLLRMKEELQAAVRVLGDSGGASRTARMVLDLAGAPRREPGAAPGA
jgi:lipid-A-disaccharide synthase